MAITFIRVDDRLIHGQIIQAWLPVIKVEEILVVSEETAKDKIRKSMMRISVPQNYNLETLNCKSATNYLKENESKKIMILCHTTKELRCLVDAGVDFKQVNIGGMHYSHGKEELVKNVFAGEEDRENLKFLLDKNIDIDTRMIPSAKNENIKKILN
ncbi:MAG: PTS sugar transporter subunit IIB [Elusimicrobiaceae bacterium]|jgi:mannose PTS system EIIA component|nr:PTS sugar transporter subunit IIB [Elusimicrobiaceae bacterium]MBT3955163.1 PTS sugar transporter subunit IIB [Elusimicrobiaceae bacterium]MBT4008684.1 PTS sugar transporter subunit IIB [Elusimicrobiaceae bacterium]MBT4402482.1 PTS sugar transporter subunit IIB [Elusimicrobiaceae bacterium]MBT4440154.1 PTS sugar transporter subunit IIB [Elusimicrobiaceae bacterium]